MANSVQCFASISAISSLVKARTIRMPGSRNKQRTLLFVPSSHVERITGVTMTSHDHAKRTRKEKKRKKKEMRKEKATSP